MMEPLDALASRVRTADIVDAMGRLRDFAELDHYDRQTAS